jgi:hypothetical protein
MASRYLVLQVTVQAHGVGQLLRVRKNKVQMLRGMEGNPWYSSIQIKIVVPTVPTVVEFIFIYSGSSLVIIKS